VPIPFVSLCSLRTLESKGGKGEEEEEGKREPVLSLFRLVLVDVSQGFCLTFHGEKAKKVGEDRRCRRLGGPSSAYLSSLGGI